MKKNKTNKQNRQKVQNEIYEFSELESLEVMVKGTRVSCELVKILTGSGKGVVGMVTAIWGLAKATVLIKMLMKRKGYNMEDFYKEATRFFEEYIQTEECEELMKESGF